MQHHANTQLSVPVPTAGGPMTSDIPEYQSLARVRAVGGVVLHDDYRSDDRQRLAAHDRSRSALQRDQPAVGGDRVRAHVRRLHAARRSCRGPARPPPDPDGRAFVVYGGVAGSRAVDRRGVAYRSEGRSGAWRGDHAARRPVDRDEHVRRGRRAQQGARDLGRARCRRGDRWCDRRRASHPLRRVAVHLLSERPDRGRRAGARTQDRARQPARHHAPAV